VHHKLKKRSLFSTDTNQHWVQKANVKNKCNYLTRLHCV